MQTFLISENPKETAKILDNKRLGKQRVEAIQIANVLLDPSTSNAWKNHPAVLMWKGYEGLLIKVYLKEIMLEWINRGFKNEKCQQHYLRLCNVLEKRSIPVIKPVWFCKEIFDSHKSNLIRKNIEYYGKLWPNMTNNLPYVWPTKI